MKKTESIQWVIDKFSDRTNYGYRPKKRNLINLHSKEVRRLKYCKECSKTWEIGITGSILFYKHLPTYKMERKKCRRCEGSDIRSYEQRDSHEN
jgi:hypothetical protein|tara:strand:+ start:15745 stop:16026 length:282 start_codon:yes stop_codon:yes gene_type:complete